MKKINQLNFLIILLLSLSLACNVFASNKDGKGKDKKPPLNKTLVDSAQSPMDINNITCWVGSDGYHDWVVGGSWNGAFPNGANAGAIFAEGIVWGGKVNDGLSPALRVNGNTYGTGCSAITRLYRVRPDYKSGNLTQDAADFLSVDPGAVSSGDVQSLRDQYQKDWNEWPAYAGSPDGDQGAPFDDKNGDGVYDPNVDVPGIPGASQTLFVKYNDNATPLYGAPAIGLEVSETYWGYSYTGALGNVIYKKVDIIYKGTSTSPPNSKITDMFIVQWADPDVGNSTDDFAGCDTALNLGYAYSSTDPDAVYEGIGLAPPAVGYDFLQGVSAYTGNPNDSALYNLKYRHGYAYVNATPMSSYAYFAAGGTWSDPDFSYTGTQEFYNLMRGFKPDPPYPSSAPFPGEVADVIHFTTPFGSYDGTYLLTGDPVAGTGKLDGSVDGPGDRRIMVTNGPITMNLNDTVEVVLALVGGIGSDHLGSITEMKNNDAIAQKVYDKLFKLATVPVPVVTAAPLNNKIILNWGEPNAAAQVENFSDQGYSFEGYDVYQLPTASSSLSDGVLLATYDKVDGITTIVDTVGSIITMGDTIPTPKIVETGTDNGLKRYYTVTNDVIENQPLRNGQEYYFSVVAYAYNPAPDVLPFHALQSSAVVITSIPQSNKPGVTYPYTGGDTLAVDHTSAARLSDGQVLPIVLDPNAFTGDNYEVTFTQVAADVTWTLTDVSTNQVIAQDQSNQSGDDDYPITGGVIVKVTSPPVAVNGYTFTPAADRWLTGYSGLGGEAFFGGLTIGANFFGSNITPDQYVTVEIRFTTNADGQKAYRYLRGGTPNYGYVDYTPQHFTVWDVDSDPPRQLAAAYVEQSGGPGDNSLWEPTSSEGDREYLFIFNTDYTETPDPFYTDHNLLGDAADFPTLYGMWPLIRGGHTFEPQDGQVFTIIPNYSNTGNDKFTFSIPKKQVSNATAKEDVKNINVFPNPYYGYQNRETSRENHYVTFSHLPQNAIIRIFDLSGVLVRTINHNSADLNNGQFERWNLQNDSNYPVASGVYVVYIDMPGVGTTKILKLAVIQEQQILKVY